MYDQVDQAKRDILRAVKVLYNCGLTSSLSGNISVKLSTRDIIIITPSGVPRWNMTEKDMVVLDLNGNVIEGKRRPSSEWRMHLAIYHARKDICSIVHAHSPYTLVLSLLNKLELMREIAEYKALIKEVTIVEYAPPGSKELAEKVAEAVSRGGNIFILERHGCLTVGSDLYRATALMEALEEVAKITYLYYIGSHKLSFI